VNKKELRIKNLIEV